jgi:hypothetical protein
MAVRIQVQPHNGESNFPVCFVEDATGIGQAGTLNNGLPPREGTLVEVSGFRRYRLKAVQLTGAGPTAVIARDIPFSQVVAAAWESVVLAAAMATGVRTVFNFGEGTAILTNFMGPYLVIALQNNGADPATYELELWGQG